jgi:hypothetical protein
LPPLIKTLSQLSFADVDAGTVGSHRAMLMSSSLSSPIAPVPFTME